MSDKIWKTVTEPDAKKKRESNAKENRMQGN